MRLTELEPQLVRYVTQSKEEQVAEGRAVPAEYLHHENSLATAQGIMFLCPICFIKNNGPIGTHKIEVTFSDRGAQDNQGSHNTQRQPSRWVVHGSGYADMTLHPSINAECWHGFVTAGEVI